MTVKVDHLGPLEQTALLTEYARALDSRAADPILADPLSDEVVSKIDFDFTRLGVTPSVMRLVALRAKMLDERIRRFVLDNPHSTVVDLGAGLNSMIHRVDPPPTVNWYSVDLPAVIDVREALLPEHRCSRVVAASLTEPGWADPIPADRPTMVVADGLVAFLTEPSIIAIVRGAVGHFPEGILAFNDYGPVSRLNRIAGRIATRGANSPHQQWNFAGFKDARYPETWDARLRLAEEASVMHRPETAAFPLSLRLASRLSRRIPSIARKARILQYRY
ncbi:class I SAM-dependent methyltransferase [Mycolicibacterium austroafricanum]|uniref:class I SAM-dependent methyltransferase n=1 Tax=Mycolicibacterium austroafricanum TaxID=39687 RepID=UPI003AF36194